MAKFGLFERAGKNPMQEFEGDFMMQNGEHVMIYEEREGKSDRQVAAIKLAPSQSIKKISD
jgi:hypothetical protein